MDFRKAMLAECFPSDHVRRARDKVRKLSHNTSVSKFLAEFKNIVLRITGMTDEEKFDRFCSGLEYEIRVEVLKSGVYSF